MIRFTLILLASILFMSQFATAQPESEVPYIRYADFESGGIIYERADGSDRTVIGAGMMPDGHAFAYAVGWSPSREWFAWQSHVTSHDDKINPSQLHIINTITGQSFTKLDMITNAGQTVWSPTEDILAVTNVNDYFYFEGGFRSTNFYLINIPTGKIIQTLEVEDTFISPRWSPDGENVLLEVALFVDPIYVISRDGQIRSFENLQYGNLTWHPDGRLRMVDVIEHDFVLLDLETETLERYDLGDISNPQETRLSGDGHYLLFQTPDLIPSEPYDVYIDWVWLLELETGRVKFLGEKENFFLRGEREYQFFLAPHHENAELIFFDLATRESTLIATHVQHAEFTDDQRLLVYWRNVTEDVGELWLYDLAEDRREKVSEATRLYSTYALQPPIIHMPGNYWISPDNRYVVYVGVDALWLYDRQDGSNTPVVEQLYTAKVQYNKDGLDSVYWLPNSTGFIADLHYLDSSQYQYLIDTETLIERDIIGKVYFSPDSRTEYFEGPCPTIISSCLYDHITGEYLAIPPHAAVNATPIIRSRPDHVKWHLDSEWLIITQYFGQGVDAPYTIVAKRDGSIIRYLNSPCYSLSIVYYPREMHLCADWTEHLPPSG